MYHTISTSAGSTFRDRGSKFTGFLLHVSTRGDIDRELKVLHGRYPDATHHCYAWRLMEENLHEYGADAGEPSGTAGAPILNALREASLVNVLLVVVRYYGGTKLGKPGLINAYSETASACIAAAAKVPAVKAAGFRVLYPYNLKRKIGSLLHKYAIIEAGTEFTDQVSAEVWCPVESADLFRADLEALSYLEVSYIETETGMVVRCET
ncbi:MAG: YigZ family protein [Cyclonatronaceae bacterium]